MLASERKNESPKTNIKQYCHQCGNEMHVDASGIARHVQEDGNIDHESDNDHTPYHL